MRMNSSDMITHDYLESAGMHPTWVDEFYNLLPHGATYQNALDICAENNMFTLAMALIDTLGGTPDTRVYNDGPTNHSNSLILAGNAEFTSDAYFNNIIVAGSIKAHGSISAEGFILAKRDILVERKILAKSFIEAGGAISAGTSIVLGVFIRAGAFISAGNSIITSSIN